jgi:hypothetical protein
MRRVLLLCLALVAALPAAAAAAAPSEDVPVSPAVAQVAESLGLTPSLNRARLAAELVRVIYGPDVRAAQIVPQLRPRDRRSAPAGNGDAVLVPVPLSADVWSRVIFRRAIAPDDLLAAILSDRRAALLCHGLAGVDAETLSYLTEHPAILGDLYEHLPAEFAAFGSSLHVRQGRVVPPGGAGAVALWQAAIGEAVDRPDRFIHALYATSAGRAAYLYDIVAELDASHASFVLGSWIPDEGARLDRFEAALSALARGYREWPVDERPFTRPLNDFSLYAARLKVDASGAPLAPASRTFWGDVFQMPDPAPPAATRAIDGRIDAAYLAEASGTPDMYARADRLDALSFAQRAFDAPGVDLKDAAAALKAMPRQRMLMLALERMGIRRPAVYVAASKQARETTAADPNRAFWMLAQYQGSLALIARARAVGSIDAATTERLVLSLAAVPVRDGRYAGGIARWIDRELIPVMPASDTAEGRLVLGLSGAVHDPASPRVSWEGQEYALDFGAASERRLHAVLEKEGAYSIDVALALSRLPARQPTARENADGHARAASLAALAESFAPPSRNALGATMAPGVDAPGSPRERIDRVLGDLRRVDERTDPDRAARVTEPLVDTADIVLGEALLSLVYAVDIGDPDGTALLASNVALRHDFGFTLHDGETRARRPWEVPRQDFLPGVPWHVTGSLLGLDVALAPLALRRIDIDRPALAPRLRSTEREAFAVNAVLIDRASLRDGDRTAVVAAMARGRAAIDRASSIADVDAAADAVRMDGWRRQALEWTFDHQRADVPSLFSLVELLELGGGAAGVNLDAWGDSAYLSTGCLCTRLAPSGGWRLYDGRPQLAFVSFVVSDLNLRVAALLEEMHLPAALQVPVMAAAVQDLIDEAAPLDAGDWLSVAQTAQALTRQRVEDYVAAAAAVDGPLVPVSDSTTARGR